MPSDNCFALFYFVINACILHVIITLIRHFLISKSRDLVSHNSGISGLKNGLESRYTGIRDPGIAIFNGNSTEQTAFIACKWQLNVQCIIVSSLWAQAVASMPTSIYSVHNIITDKITLRITSLHDSIITTSLGLYSDDAAAAAVSRATSIVEIRADRNWCLVHRYSISMST